MKPPNHGMRVRVHSTWASGRAFVTPDGWLSFDPWVPGIGGRYTHLRIITGSYDGVFTGMTLRTGDRVEVLR